MQTVHKINECEQTEVLGLRALGQRGCRAKKLLCMSGDFDETTHSDTRVQADY